MAGLVDIEDFGSQGATGDVAGSAAFGRSSVVARRKINDSQEVERESEHKIMAGNFLPGTQRIWVRTFGCAHNQSDSEYMLGQLQENGYR